MNGDANIKIRMNGEMTQETLREIKVEFVGFDLGDMWGKYESKKAYN